MTPGSPYWTPVTSLPREQALAGQEPERELLLVAGRAHRDRDLDRLLARAGGTDLERLLADDEVVADLQLGAADGDDPRARDVARRQLRVERGRLARRGARRPVDAAARVIGARRAGQAEVAAGSCECMRPSRCVRRGRPRGAGRARRPAVGPGLDVAADGEDQALRRRGDLGDGGLEGLGVARGGLAEAADLAHVLARGGLDLAGRRGVVLVAEGSDASAHGGSVPAVVRAGRTGSAARGREL